MSRPPDLIPVLDLMGGVVVRGIAGRRETYQPLQTPLSDRPDPLIVARALRERVGGSALYVADLDGILAGRPNWNVLQQLKLDGFHLVVDVGLRSPDDVRPLLELGVSQIVAALETLPGPEVLTDLRTVVGAQRLIFSLDLRDGELLTSPQAPWKNWTAEEVAATVAAAGVQRLLVLDLIGVGTAGGMATLPLCRRLRAAFPELKLWTGGGVRDWRDVEQAGASGIEAVLVSTALHTGRLTRPAATVQEPAMTAHGECRPRRNG
jgi:phosphoribosylformimino-5-aminoimidazole carboxamide ribotide isomerase